MATVTVQFGQLWLTPDADRAHGMPFELNDIEYDDTIDVTTTRRAGGNFTADGMPGAQRIAKIELNFCTDVQNAALRGWYRSSTLLWLRAPDGTKFPGLFANGTTFAPRPMGNSWIVPFTFEEVTISEAV